MPQAVPDVPPGDYELPSIAGVYDGFIVLSTLGFVVLYVERGLYSILAEGQRSVATSALAIALAAIIVFAGFLASFYLPRRVLREDPQSNWLPHTLNFLFGQFVISAACIGLSSLVVLAIYVYLVYPDLVAIAWLIRDVAFIVAIGAFIYHGYLIAVRYLGLLYQTGGADRLKVITFQVAVAVFLIVVGLWNRSTDFTQIMAAAPGQGLLVLHLTIQGILQTLLVGAIFIFQLSRAGDH